MMIDFNKYKESKEEELNKKSEEISKKLENIDADAIVRLITGKNIENDGNIDNTILNKVDKEKAKEGLEAGMKALEIIKRNDPEWGKGKN